MASVLIDTGGAHAYAQRPMRPHPPRQLLQLVVLTCVMAMFLPSPAWAQKKLVGPPETDEGIKAQPFLTLSHTGYFRLRSDLFLNGSLGNGTSGFRDAAYTVQPTGKADSESVSSGVNLRFRWRPELRVGQSLRIVTVIDVMDNVVLGSTADYHADRIDTPLVFLSETQGGFADAIRVKQVFGEWDVLHALRVRAGRMADHFGLGMVYNDGECIDCDFGDTTDRVDFLVAAFGFHSLWFVDMPFEGATTRRSFEAFGQASDLTNMDDVIRWGFTIGQKPMDDAEKDQRTKDLAAGKVVVDWILRNTFTSQELSTGTYLGDRCDDGGETDPLGYEFDCQTLAPRDVSLWTPDVWAKLQWHPKADMRFRAEIELAGVVGDVGYTQTTTEAPSDKDFLGMGGVLQLELQHRRMSYELEVGFATGDDVLFGPYGESLVAPDDDYVHGKVRMRNNKTINRFMFNRDFHVGLLLYREVIGAVTNSVYFKPTVKAELFESGEHRIGGEVALLYAHALDGESTPGRANPLGLELDANVFYELGDHGRADLDLGLLVPLAAFDNGVAPEVAFSIQLRLAARF